jgi:hypothetical protein
MNNAQSFAIKYAGQWVSCKSYPSSAAPSFASARGRIIGYGLNTPFVILEFGSHGWNKHTGPPSSYQYQSIWVVPEKSIKSGWSVALDDIIMVEGHNKTMENGVRLWPDVCKYCGAPACQIFTSIKCSRNCR